MIKLDIGTRIRISKEQLPREILRILKIQFSHSYQAKNFRKINGEIVVEEETRFAITYLETDQYVYFPRGAISNIIVFLKEKGYKVKVNRFLSKQVLEVKEFNPELFLYQSEARDKMTTYEEGVLDSSCGSGKTIIGLSIVEKLKLKTLILVHTVLLQKQWVSNINKVLGDYNVGVLGSGQKIIKPITVGMVQTLKNFDESQFSDVRRYFGCILVDECHHIPAYTFMKVLTNFAPSRLYGLSATPQRKDGKEFLLYDFVGPLIYKISDKTLIDADRITDVEVKWKDISLQYKAYDWYTLINSLTTSIDRNQILVDCIEEAAKQNYKILVLSERVQHCQVLDGMLLDRGVKSLCVTGDNRKNAEIMFSDRSNYNVIVATQSLAKEGLDMPELDCIVLATPVNNQHMVKQMIGRGRRAKDHKTLVLDFNDIHSSIGFNTANNRRKWYQEWNFDEVN